MMSFVQRGVLLPHTRGGNPWAPLSSLCLGSSPGVLGPQKPMEVGGVGSALTLWMWRRKGGQAHKSTLPGHPAMG